MPRLTSIRILTTIGVVIAVAIGAGAQAQELSCPPGYAPDQSNTSCVPSRPSAAPVQGGVAGQAQQILNSIGAAVQGAPSNATGALGGILNSFGLGGSDAAPTQPSGGAAPTQPSGGAEQAEVGGTRTSDHGDRHSLTKTSGHGPCALLTANDIAAVLGESADWSSAGTPSPDSSTACSYSTPSGTDVNINLAGGRAEFHKLPSELPGMTALSGVGDAAYDGPKSTGGSGGGAQVFVLKGNTYFYITVESDNGDASDARSAAALARKVAARL